MKISNKIGLSFLIVAMTLSAIAGTTVYFVAKNNLEESIRSNLNSVLASRVAHIETYLKMLKTSVGQLSKSITLRDFLKINGTQNVHIKEAFELAMERLAGTQEANPAIAEILMMDNKGKVIV